MGVILGVVLVVMLAQVWWAGKCRVIGRRLVPEGSFAGVRSQRHGTRVFVVGVHDAIAFAMGAASGLDS